MSGQLKRRLRAGVPTFLLALTVYVPLLLTRPGRVGADTKTYLYLDPSRLLSRASSMWDPSIGLGTVTHQNIGYLWPIGPYYWLAETIGVPDWLAQRFWTASIMFLAGLGVRFMLRAMGQEGPHVTAATFCYALTPYVLTLSARLSVILLPYAGLPWLLGLTVLALRRRRWREPAVFALVVAQDPSEAFRGGITEIHVDYALVSKWEIARGYFIPVGVGDGEWYRMITSGFLHYGVIHLLFNMYALWVLGGAVEHIGGRGRLAAAYGVAILAGSLGALIVTPDAFTAGASGGVFGLMGTILVAQRLQGVAFRDSPLIGVLMLNLLFTFGISNISVGGHIGGLIGGALAGWLLFAPDVQRRSQGAIIGYVLCAVVAVGCLVGGVVIGSSV